MQWLSCALMQECYKDLGRMCSEIIFHCLLVSSHVSHVLQFSDCRIFTQYLSHISLRLVLLVLPCSNCLS